MKSFTRLVIGTFALGTALSAVAHAKTYQIQKDYSIIEFRIRHLVSMSEGHFADFDGMINYDPTHPEKATVLATIHPASIDTRNKKRDKHLRGDDFFNAAKYPTANFVSQSVKRTGPGHLRVAGMLTLHGETKPVTLDVSLRGTTTDDLGRHRLGFAAETRFNRKDFGISWNEKLDNGGWLLGDEVELEIEIDAVETP